MSLTGPMPFVRLAAPRAVDRPDFPRDLVQFYSENEAVEFEDSEDYGSLYLKPLRDVKRVGWAGLEFIWDSPEGWERFDALLIGGGCFFERIVSVIHAPGCPPGSVLALGGSLGWGGGTGPHRLETALVLAPSFSEWLEHLEEYDWWEYGVGYGIPDLPVPRQRALRAYYRALNPHIEWPEP